MKKQPSDFPRPTHAEIDILHDFGMLGSCSDWESMYEEAMYGWEDEVERRYKEQEDSSALRDVGGVIRGMFYAGFGVSPPEEEEAERQQERAATKLEAHVNGSAPMTARPWTPYEREQHARSLMEYRASKKFETNAKKAEEVIRKVMGWNGAESSTPSQGATVIMKNWPEMTQNEKQEIANRVLLEIEKKSKTATHVNFYDVCGVLDLPSDVQSGVRNALEERGFINWVSMGIAHITTEGASYAAKLRSKPE